MRIILTNHARLRAAQREVSFEQIVDCITNPDQISEEADDKLRYKKLQYSGTHLLLCYTVNQQGDIVVVTVIKTSKIGKYLD